MLLYGFNDDQRLFFVVDRDNEKLRLVRASRMQEFQPRRVTIENLGSQFAHQLDLFGIEVKHRGLDPLQIQDASNDMAKASESCKDHGIILFIDLIGFSVGELARKQRLYQAFVDREEERRRDHRQSHCRDKQIADSRINDLVLGG